MTKNKNTLLEGTAILATAAFISKFLGFIYKAFLARLIGAQGLGIYEKAYPIYTMILTISIVGIPVAISKLVAEKRAQGEVELADYIFKVALKISFVFGLIASIAVGLLAKPLARYLLDDINVYYSILAIAPAIFIVSIMATYRGYFQGHQRMKPTAISQVVEQLIRMTTMILLAYLLISYGVEFGAAGAAAGAFFGAIGGLIVVLIIYHKFQKSRELKEDNIKEKPEFKEVFRGIFSLAIPVTMGALILPVMRLIDASLITRRLRVAGFALDRATSLYGQFNGMAMTLVRFPTVIAASLAVSLVPAISEAYTLKADKLAKSRIAKAFKLTLYVSIPATVGLFILARPLCSLIFANEEAAISMRYVAFGVVAVSLQQVTSSILQGFAKAKLPALNLFFGAILNAILNYTLTAIPTLGIRGAALGTVAGFTLAAVLNIWAVFKIVKPDFDYNILIFKPLIAASLMGVITRLTYRGIKFQINLEVVNTLGAVLAGMISYAMILLLLGAIGREDLKLVPKVGDRLVRFLDKVGLLK